MNVILHLGNVRTMGFVTTVSVHFGVTVDLNGWDGSAWTVSFVCIPTWAATWQNQQSDCAPSEDSDQPGHPPSLVRVFAVRLMGSWGPNLSSCGQRRLWSDWADAHTDLSLRWAHSHFVGFVMSRLILLLKSYVKMKMEDNYKNVNLQNATACQLCAY